MALTLRKTITDETPKILEFLKDYTSNKGWEIVNGGEIPDKKFTFRRATLGGTFQVGMLGNKVRSIYRGGSETVRYKTFGSGNKARNYYTYDSEIYDEVVFVVENYYTEGSQITLKLYENTSTNEVEYELGMSHGYSEQNCLNFSIMGKRHNGQVDYISDGRGVWDKLRGDEISQFENDAPYKATYLMGGVLGERVYTLDYEMIISNVKKADGTIEPVKVFKTYDGANAYFNDGSLDDLIDGEETPDDDELAEDREVTLYYESDIFKRAYNSSNTTRVGSNAIRFRVQYKNNLGVEIVNPYRAICGYVATNNTPNNTNYFGNIVWIANNNINLIETSQNPVIGAQITSKTIPNYANTTGFYPPYISNNDIYDARYRTNMRIFANEQDARDFLGGGNPTPIGESGNKFNPSGFIGDKTVFNDGHDLRGGGMSSCWIMNETQLQDLANVFQTGLTKVEEDNGKILVNITKTSARAFASHGEPIDAVVDLFWLPFDPTEFVTTGANSFQLSRDDLSSASSLIKFVASSGDTVVAHGGKAYDLATSNVTNVISDIGGMLSTTTQKVKNVSE